jgi:hypothetical protein
MLHVSLLLKIVIGALLVVSTILFAAVVFVGLYIAEGRDD